MLKSLIAGALALVLAACATPGTEREKVQFQLENIRTGFLVAELAVATYSALPECSAKVTVGCSNVEAATKARVLLSAVSAGLDAADAVMRDEASDMTARQKALSIAQTALRTLTLFLNEYRISKGQR